MTNTIIKPKEGVFFIAYNADKTTIHTGFVSPNNVLITPLEFVEEYLDETEYLNRKIELGIPEDELTTQ
jgi:hypothetical protein